MFVTTRSCGFAFLVESSCSFGLWRYLMKTEVSDLSATSLDGSSSRLYSAAWSKIGLDEEPWVSDTSSTAAFAWVWHKSWGGGGV